MSASVTTIPSVRAEPEGEFNEASHHVDLTPEERTIGVATRLVFDQRIKRNPVWHTRRQAIHLPKGRITETFKRLRPDLVSRDDGDFVVVRPDDIAREKLSTLLGNVIFTFKRIEDKLPDFSGRSGELFRNFWGINRSYYQWSQEEGQHSDAAEAILVATGHKSQSEIDEDYLDNLTQTWESPYPTSPRKMVLYAAYQETVTGANYEGLAARADREDAPITAEILRFVSRDENFHSGGYRMFAQAFAEWDLQGSIRDAVKVASEFRMPAQHLMIDPRRNSLEIVRAGAFGKQMVIDAITKAMKGLGFVPEELLTETVDTYWR